MTDALEARWARHCARDLWNCQRHLLLLTFTVPRILKKFGFTRSQHEFFWPRRTGVPGAPAPHASSALGHLALLLWGRGRASPQPPGNKLALSRVLPQCQPWRRPSLTPRANPAGPILPEPFPLQFSRVRFPLSHRERICNLLVWLLYLPTRIEGPGRHPCTLCLK